MAWPDEISSESGSQPQEPSPHARSRRGALRRATAPKTGCLMGSPEPRGEHSGFGDVRASLNVRCSPLPGSFSRRIRQSCIRRISS